MVIAISSETFICVASAIGQASLTVIGCETTLEPL